MCPFFVFFGLFKYDNPGMPELVFFHFFVV